MRLLGTIVPPRAKRLLFLGEFSRILGAPFATYYSRLIERSSAVIAVAFFMALGTVGFWATGPHKWASRIRK